MTTTLTMPHFINYPASLPGHVPCTLPPVTPPVNTQFNNNQPVANSNGNSGYGTVPLQVPVVPVGGGCYNDGMEVVWHGEFSRLFSNFFPPHVWYLTITNQAPPHKWKFHRDSAKVRFCCQDCGNGWTSMKGRVTFWFHLDYERNAGFVQFKLYGQQCKKCNSGKFEYVMWYPEEVSKVMCNAYHKVGQTYYGFLQPPIRIDRRPGRPRNQHNADLCQACRDGECDQARSVKPLLNINNIITSPLPVPTGPAKAIAPTSPNTSPPSVNSTLSDSSGSEASVVVQSTPGAVISSAEVTSKPVANGVGYIATPVSIGAGVQPMLAYSMVAPSSKSPALTVAANQMLPPNAPLPQVNAHYIYHPNPHQIMGGAIPIHPSTIYPVLPRKQIIKPGLKTQVQPATVTAITNGMEATKIDEELEADDTLKGVDSTTVENGLKKNETSSKNEPKKDEGLLVTTMVE